MGGAGGVSAARARDWRLGNPLRRLAGSALYYASYLLPRNRRLWVFGNSRGFGDNARFLAEHVHHTQPDIEVWWIARSRREAEAARAAGLRTTLLRSRQAWRIQARAGVAFLCSAYSDVRTAVMGGTFLVHLYHGIPLKRVLLDVDHAQFMRGPRALRGIAAALSRALMDRRLARIDLIVAPGELARERFISAFEARPERVKVLGTPRFDVILGGAAYERVAGSDVRARLGLPATGPLVLWLPTWRQGGDAWLPPLEGRLLDLAFEGTDALMLVKPHPLSDVTAFRAWAPAHPRMRLLAHDDLDANCLLRLADVLITDYSSAAFDYAILDRPLYLFVPDAAEYNRADRGLYESLETYSGGMYHTDWPALMTAVRDALRAEGEAGLALSRRIRARSANADTPGSCERIVDEIRSAIGLDRPAAKGAGGRRRAGPSFRSSAAAAGDAPSRNPRRSRSRSTLGPPSERR